MAIVPVEYLAPAAFLTGLVLGAAVSYATGRRRGYGEGLEAGRSGR